MQYRNKNGEVFDISVENTNGEAMAFVNGNYIAKASTEPELEEILDHFSHANPDTTMNYLGLKKEETAN